MLGFRLADHPTEIQSTAIGTLLDPGIEQLTPVEENLLGQHKCIVRPTSTPCHPVGSSPDDVKRYVLSQVSDETFKDSLSNGLSSSPAEPVPDPAW